ncbi:hypothetical protein K3495_g8777 [Podosphaera aphanis]|nr:hypothetical protein K3495_g8777 [Podosphaera aphanis]
MLLGFWNALKAKHNKPQIIVSFYTNKIAIFTYKEDAGLGENWARLLSYRCKAISANPRMNHAYPDDVLFDILADKLPDLYKSTVFSLRTQLMYTVDQKMQFLYQIESKTSTLYGIDSEEEESARIAKDRNRGRRNRASSHPTRDCSESDQSIHDSWHKMCYLCKMKHFVRSCPDLELAVRAVEKHHENRRRDAKAKRSSRTKSYSTSSKAPLKTKISTRRDWVYPLANKAEAYNSVNKWKTMVELQLNKKFKAAGCDNAPELIKAIKEWNAKDGVTMELTTISAPHQNGPAERTIQTVNADSRAIIKDAELPLEFWDEAAEADCYMRNRTASVPRINGKRISPLEAFTGKIPEIDHIRRWGSKCYYFVDRKSIPAKERKDKLINPARVGVFMGYSETTTSHFKVYSPELGCTIEVSILKVDKKINGGTIDLKIRSSGIGAQGTKNKMNDRNPRGRPKNTTLSSTEKSTLSSDHLRKPMQEPSHESETGPKSVLSADDPYSEDTDSVKSVIPELPQPVDTISTGNKKKFNNTVPTEQCTPEQIIRKKKTSSENITDKRKLSLEAKKRVKSVAPATPQPTVKEKDINEKGSPILLKLQTSTKLSNEGSNGKPNNKITVTSESQASKIQMFEQPNQVTVDQSFPTHRQNPKRLRAFLANTLDNEGNVNIDVLKSMLREGFESAFPVDVKCGITIPRTYIEAVNDPRYSKQWKAAMAEEMLALHSNNTFREVLPKSANLVTFKWVYAIKTKDNCSLKRFKAKLVARGFSQVFGEDYNETFAPTVCMDTLRLFLATVAAEDLECYQFDIKNAFIESHLEETIYLSPPKCLDVKKGYVWQALRSLYGLKQAARDWNKLFEKELKSKGFIQSLADPCLFTHLDKSLKLLVYVDDCVASARKSKEIDWFSQILHDPFKTKPLGEIKKILGARITRDRQNRTLYLDQ